MASYFLYCFVFFLLLQTGVHWVLTYRQSLAVGSKSVGNDDRTVDESDPTERAKSTAYTLAKLKLEYIAITLNVLIILAWTLGGGLAWMDSAILNGIGIKAGSMMHGLCTIGAVVLINTAIAIPLSLYATFVIENKFGFNQTGLSLFLSDKFKQLVLGVILGGLLLAIILGMMDALSETAWWFWAWCVLLAWNLLLLVVWPRWLAPLFNKFTPLPSGEVNDRLQKLFKRCGFHTDQIYVIDGSKRSKHSNAYLTGLGKSKRVVLYDTLIEALTPEQTEAVLAHELGHSAHGHIPQRLLVMMPVWLFALWLLNFMMHTDWFFAAFGVPTHHHIALLLFWWVIPPFIFIFQPLINAFSRRHEFEADAYAALFSDKGALIDALHKIYRDNAVSYQNDDWYTRWHYSHPPPRQRIERLRQLGH